MKASTRGHEHTEGGSGGGVCARVCVVGWGLHDAFPH